MKKLTPRSVNVYDLKAHPKNYREHPEKQIAHIVKSIDENGFYRNIVATKGLTILAGHGSVTAAIQAGLTEVPVVTIDIDPMSKRALKILAGDNEVSELGVLDNNSLAEILREIIGPDEELESLFGTGIDEQMFEDITGMADGYMVEAGDIDAMAEWDGMPSFEHEDKTSVRKIIVHFVDEDGVREFTERLGCSVTDKTKYIWFPAQGNDEVAHLRHGTK